MLSLVNTSYQASGIAKRKRCSDISDTSDVESCSVRQKLLILESEESRPTFEDSESCCSFQERETDVPHDNLGSDSSVEYTLCSNSETDRGSSSSGSSNINTKKIETIIIIEDVGGLGGSSESDSDQDSELPKADFWSCKCGAKKNNPRFGTCQKCFKARTSFLPTRPRRKARRRNGKKTLNESELTDPSSGSQASGSGLSQELSQLSTSSSESQRNDCSKCSVCLEQPVDGVFVHGNSGHDYACYRCSVRIYKVKKRCPICNRAVNNVIKLYKLHS